MNKPLSNRETRAGRVRRAGMLSAEEERHLLQAWQGRGDHRARDRLIGAFAPLAASMARRAAPAGQQADPDLVQQANIGLMKAADRFDPERGNRFATYAVWWIRAEIQEHKRTTGSVVRRPNSARSRQVAGLISQLDSAQRDDPQVDRARTDRHIANALGVNVETVADLRARIFGNDLSLNVPAVDSEGEDLMTRLVDPASLDDPGQIHRLDVGALRRVLVDVLFTLPDRERDIIVATQLSDPAATLEGLGARYGISKERVRQLRERGFERLRDTLQNRGLALDCFV